jgi:hypothetical protein
MAITPDLRKQLAWSAVSAAVIAMAYLMRRRMLSAAAERARS